MNNRLHVVALALAAAVFMSACNDEGTEAVVVAPPASTVTQVISFGDSLSDVGTYNPTTADTNPANDSPGGFIFSTKPGMTWNSHVAIHFGQTLTPNRQVRFGVVGNGGEILELGGLAYAEGGARIEVDAPNGGVVMQPIPNVGTVPVQLATSRAIKTQIDDYLAEHGNAIDGQATLVLIQGGANDIFGFLGQVAGDPALAANAPAVVAATATAMVTQIARLQAAGATRIIYSNLPDLGLTPQFRTTPLAGLATQVSAGYNAAVAGALSGDVHVFDTGVFMQEVVASPATYGFTNATTPACTEGLSSLLCFPTTVVAPGADIMYVFADGVHPTTNAHALWGQQVVAAFPSP